MNVEISGAGVFAAASRAAIEREAWLLSLVSGTLILLLMLRIYRRPRIVALCFVPVASGIAVGTAAVSLAFGNVHAITLGFGATLIGEAVDYPSYACLNAAPGESLRRALERIWPTLRLAVLTTVLGGLTMLLSSFAGLAQLGLLTMSGVLVAGLVTRDVVPVLAGPLPVTTQPSPVSPRLNTLIAACAARCAPPVGIAAAGGGGLCTFSEDKLWEDDLARDEPGAGAAEGRRPRAAPRARRAGRAPPLLVLRGETARPRSNSAEALEGKLDELVSRGAIRGYDLATRYVPSLAAADSAASLPFRNPPHCGVNLEHALRGLPFRRGAFEPFLRDVEESRQRGPLGAEALRGTVLGLKFQTAGRAVRQGLGGARSALRRVPTRSRSRARCRCST